MNRLNVWANRTISACYQTVHSLWTWWWYVGFEVLTPMVMKSSVYLAITSCSPLKINRCLIGKCRLHLQGRIISQKRKKSVSRTTGLPKERERQRELTFCFVFPSCFPYKQKFRLAGYSTCYLIQAGFLLPLFFDTEDGGDMFLRNVG
jgi:hypothetical protein